MMTAAFAFLFAIWVPGLAGNDESAVNPSVGSLDGVSLGLLDGSLDGSSLGSLEGVSLGLLDGSLDGTWQRQR